MSATDVRFEERNIASVRSAYLTDLAQLEGSVLRRHLAEGTLLTVNQLAAQKIVQRGQSVTLLAQGRGISVRMEGKALADGTKEQRIAVLNGSSNRVVEGVVRDRETVLIDL